MLVLVESETPEKGKRCKAELCGDRIGRLSVLRLKLSVPSGIKERAVKKALKKAFSILERYPSAVLTFRDDFPFREAFLNAGFKETDLVYIIRKKAWEVILAAAEGRERVFVSIGSLGETERDALVRLCQKFRYIELDAPEAVFKPAAKRLAVLGVSPTVPKTGRSDADAALLFTRPRTEVSFSEKCAVLCLCGVCGAFGGRALEDVEFLPPESVSLNVPSGYDAAKIASYAAEKGVLNAGLINIAYVRLCDKNEKSAISC